MTEAYMPTSRFFWIGSSKLPIRSLYICFKTQPNKRKEHITNTKRPTHCCFGNLYKGNLSSDLPQEMNNDIDS